MTVRNLNRVPLKQWSKWRPLSQRVFNDVFAEMRDQSNYLHSKTPTVPSRQWHVTRFNAAWIAADAAVAAYDIAMSAPAPGAPRAR